MRGTKGRGEQISELRKTLEKKCAENSALDREIRKTFQGSLSGSRGLDQEEKHMRQAEIDSNIALLNLWQRYRVRLLGAEHAKRPSFGSLWDSHEVVRRQLAEYQAGSEVGSEALELDREADVLQREVLDELTKEGEIMERLAEEALADRKAKLAQVESEHQREWNELRSLEKRKAELEELQRVICDATWLSRTSPRSPDATSCLARLDRLRNALNAPKGIAPGNFAGLVDAHEMVMMRLFQAAQRCMSIATTGDGEVNRRARAFFDALQRFLRDAGDWEREETLCEADVASVRGALDRLM